MKQSTINKILVTAILFLTVIILTLRFTEHERVTYYVCYDWHTSENINRTDEEAKEICQERND